MPGYHLYKIPKGTLGEYSKVIEEFHEFQDALTQNCFVMALVELSDLIGALKLYFYANDKAELWELFIFNKQLNNLNYPLFDPSDLFDKFENTLDFTDINHWNNINIFMIYIGQYVLQFNLTIHDLYTMSAITQRVFKNGHRF